MTRAELLKEVEEIREVTKRSASVLERTEREQERIRRSVARSNQRADRAFEQLRQAGLLK